MQPLNILPLCLVAMTTPLAAQGLGQGQSATESPVDIPAAPTGDKATPAWRIALNEAAIDRYRIALKLTAEQEKYWPAAENAMRALAHMQRIDNRAVWRVAPAISPLIKSLDDRQKQTAIDFFEQAGFARYLALFRMTF